MRAPRYRVPLEQAAIVWVLVFLIGLTAGAVLRQQGVGNPTPTETNRPTEPAVEAMATPASSQAIGMSSGATAPRPAVPNQTTSTTVAVPSTTVLPHVATVAGSDPDKAPPTTLEPPQPSTTTSTSTTSSTTTTTTAPPQTTTTTVGCNLSACPGQPGEDAS
jgi:hypothetical protein